MSTWREPIEALEQLAVEFERVAAEGAPSRARVLLPARRTLVLVALLVALLAAAAIAADKLVFVADPPNLDEAIQRERTPESRAPAARTTTVDATAPDPAGSAPWGVLVYTSRTGDSCVTAGRVIGGMVGALHADGSFTPYPTASGAPCAPRGSETVGLLADYHPDDPSTPGQEPGRTLAYGVAGADVVKITFHGAGSIHAVRPGRRGGFIVVYPGEVARGNLDASATLRDGREVAVP